jgi:hypothetical protein
MAKELPYFKFNASEWISGEITLEDLLTQGAFINICAYYWFKSGCITLTEIKRRLKLKQGTIDSLVSGGHIKLDGDAIEITFLREQFDERGHISKRNSENGKKGGAPKGNSNAKNEEKNNREQPKTTNIEEEKEVEEKREEENRIELWPTFDDFWDLYDKKQDRAACEKKWKKIGQGDREEIMQHLQLYIPSTPDKNFRKNPETYLNNRSWENEVILKPIFNGKSTKQNNTDKLIQGWAERVNSVASGEKL